MRNLKPWRRTALAAALLATTAISGFAIAQPEPVNPPAMTQPRAVLPDFSDLVAQVKPAVVSITTTIDVAQVAGAKMPAQLPFPFNQMIPHGDEGVHEARGSGFLIRQDGLIVTNNHVVKDGSSVSVTLDDGTELKAKVLGTDTRTDIALLKVDAGKPLHYHCANPAF